MRTALLAAGLLLLGIGAAPAQTAAQPDSWPDLVASVFDGRPIEDGAAVLALDAPYRAEDAAVVPITIRSTLPAGSALRVEKITLVIDENPAPVAAEFTFGPAGPVSAIETRVRVDSYTNIHAVAALSDGKLYSVAKFVKASGGCSAPASKNPAEAKAGLGELKLRWFDGAAASGPRDAQVMLRHPNNSGMQMDQVTRNYVPAFFVRDLTVSEGDKVLFSMEGGISISENPTFRFTYSGSGGPLAVKAVDTDDNRFEATFQPPSGAT